MRWLRAQRLIEELPLRDFVAAVSVGMHGGRVLVDLDYAEDSTCETDMNVVMTGSGGFVEVQGTAEGAPFTQQDLDAMLAAARSAIAVLLERQRVALAAG
jgi:ribonuclease PH